MGGPRVDHTKSGKERQILHGITHMWNLKYNTLNLYLFTWKINTVTLKRQAAKQYVHMILFL